MDVHTRFWLDSEPEVGDDYRYPFERDADIILYSSAFRRLKSVTQVIPAMDGTGRTHDRLIHSLKVAQVGKRIAQKLISDHPDLESYVFPDAVYFAGLAHDIGHPPFGHIAEQELQSILDDEGSPFFLPDGFEGNAQTFRVLIRGAQKSRFTTQGEFSNPRRGMGLTAGSIIATMKYPWERGAAKRQLERYGRTYSSSKDGYYSKKWGMYADDLRLWQSIEDEVLLADTRLIVNSQIMDLADDITYAIHDIQDHYRSGSISFGALVDERSTAEETQFWEHTLSFFSRRPEFNFSTNAFSRAREWLEKVPFPRTPFDDSRSIRAQLHRAESFLVTKILDEVKIDQDGDLQIPPALRMVLEQLKQMTWYYVINNPRLASIQQGQRRLIRELHLWLCQWYIDCEADRSDPLYLTETDRKLRSVPKRLRELVDDTSESSLSLTEEQRVSRAVVDYIGTLTDNEAMVLHHNLGGVSIITPPSWL